MGGERDVERSENSRVHRIAIYVHQDSDAGTPGARAKGGGLDDLGFLPKRKEQTNRIVIEGP